MSYTLKKEGIINVLLLDDLWNPEENLHLIKEIEDAIKEGSIHYIIDCAALPFLNSNGLAFLISILTRARSAGGEVIIINISEKIEQILIMTRLRSTFQVANDMESAKELLIENQMT